MPKRESIRRDRLVRQLEERGIQDPAVLRAMREVPRERFVEEALQGKAYSDAPLPIGEKQTISQPWIVARMAELLEEIPMGASVEFLGLFEGEETKLGMIVTFLALLELIRLRRVKVYQRAMFGPIRVFRPVGPEGEVQPAAQEGEA